jgi:DNA-binding NtrC family response regulator
VLPFNPLRVIPPVRERIDDVPPLAHHFGRLAVDGWNGTFSPSAIDALQAHDWPGNVRKLRHTVGRALASAGGGPVRRRWDTARVAERLGVARSTVYRRMEKLSIRRSDIRPETRSQGARALSGG